MNFTYDLILFGVVIAWSIQKVIDKQLLKHSKSKIFTDWVFITHFILLIPFIFFVELIEIKYLIIIFLFSFITVLSSRLLFKGMKKDEVSRVTPFSQFSAFFAVILSIIFLKETPSMINIIGILLMVVSGFIFSTENGFKNIKSFIKENYAIIIVLISAFLSSMNILVNKVVLFSATAFSLLFFRRMFSAIWVIPSIAKNPKISDWPLFITSRILSTGGLLALFFVLSKQEIYLTAPILAIQPLIVLFLSHRLLDEKKHFLSRLIAIIIMIVGYILLKI